MAKIEYIQITSDYCSMQLTDLDPEWTGETREVIWYISGDIQEGKYGADIEGVPADGKGGFVEFSNLYPETTYEVQCIIVIKETQQQLAWLPGEFTTLSLGWSDDIKVEYYSSGKGILGTYLSFELNDYVYEDDVLRAVDDYGNVYKRTITSQTLFPSIYVGDRYSRMYSVSLIRTDGTVIELGNYVTLPPPGTLSNITANSWIISGNCGVDYSNADLDVSYVEIQLHRSKTTASKDFRQIKTIRLYYPSENYFSFDVAQINNYTDYPYYKVTIDTYIEISGSELYNIQDDQDVSDYITLPASPKWTWSDTALQAFQNHGYTTALTVDEWNEFVEFVAIKTGYDLQGDLMTATDNIMTASRFNHIRNAIGSLNTFREGQNSIADYIYTREGTYDGDWNMRTGEVVKGQYFIDLAEYANQIE